MFRLYIPSDLPDGCKAVRSRTEEGSKWLPRGLKMGLEELARRLRALAALPDDPGFNSQNSHGF